MADVWYIFIYIFFCSPNQRFEKMGKHGIVHKCQRFLYDSQIPVIPRDKRILRGERGILGSPCPSVHPPKFLSGPFLSNLKLYTLIEHIVKICSHCPLLIFTLNFFPGHKFQTVKAINLKLQM